MAIVREGYPYILVTLIPTVVFFVFRWYWMGGVFLALTFFVMFFFRDPERKCTVDSRKVLSPADGRVVSIRNVDGQEVLSIFLSIFDVHVNRAPIAGTISEVQYRPGKFLVAFDERASTENEQNSITIQGEKGSVRFIQIAGLIARRIVCWRKPGEKLLAGERIGLIKFGSRVDVFLPPGGKFVVQKGMRVKAGETVIGELP